jgi:AcrR family transcriptional regulator
VNNSNIPKKSTGKRRAYHHGDLRRALIAATLEAIVDEGPEGFTLRDVARRAGVSPAAPYRHFTDKDQLLTEVAIECLARLGEEVAAAVAEAPPDALSQFRATGIAYVRFAAAHPALFRATTIPGMFDRLPPDHRARYLAQSAAQRAAIIAAQEAGEIARMPIDELLLAANTTVHGLAHQIVEGLHGEVDAARATALATAVTGVLGVGLYPR